VLKRFDVQRVILVADRGLLSLDNVAEIKRIADEAARRLEFILAVPARRYIELGGTLQGLKFKDGLAEGRFAEHRMVVAQDPVRAAEQGVRRKERITELEAFATKLIAKLDAQDAGRTERGRRASDRGAYSRFNQAVREAELCRFFKIDLNADRFSYELDDEAIEHAELFDGKLVLLTSVADFSPQQIVERYKALADIERGFRVLKSDIEIAPVYHRLPERIRAHGLICFLALLLYRVMRQRLKASGSPHSPSTALELLRRIQQHRATIGEHSYSGLSKTTPEQLSLFEALDLRAP
jgi:transposase